MALDTAKKGKRRPRVTKRKGVVKTMSKTDLRRVTDRKVECVGQDRRATSEIPRLIIFAASVEQIINCNSENFSDLILFH